METKLKPVNGRGKQAAAGSGVMQAFVPLMVWGLRQMRHHSGSLKVKPCYRRQGEKGRGGGNPWPF